jgi:hypothetical protein
MGSGHEVRRRHSSFPTPNPSRPRGSSEATGSTTAPPQVAVIVVPALRVAAIAQSSINRTSEGTGTRGMISIVHLA